MAWVSVGRAGSTGNAGPTTTLTVTLNGQAGSGANVGDLLVFAVSMNPTAVTTSTTSVVNSVVDSASNQWVKDVVISRATANSAHYECWWSRIENALTTSNTVSVNYSLAADNGPQTGICWRFRNSGGSVRVFDSTYITAATSGAGSMDLSATPGEFLWFRGMTIATTLATALSTTAGWTTIGTTRSAAGGGGAKCATYGEFLITSASTAATSPSFTAAGANCSGLTIFEEMLLMGDGEL